MEKYESVKKNGKTLVGVRAYQGDAMTLLAFDLDSSRLENLVGFTIRVTQGNRAPYFLTNRLSFKPEILKLNKIVPKQKLSSLFAPYQKFRWVHVPFTEHYVDNPYFGDYTYEVTPRYLKDGILQDLDPALTVKLTIEVCPFKSGKMQLGFTRAFVSSQAYAERFGNNGKIRPNKDDLIFDIKQTSGNGRQWNPETKKYETMPYTFEDQHEYLGWQARRRIMEFLDETINNENLKLAVFAFDLDEPLIVQKFITLAQQGRLRIILDDSKDHVGNSCFEDQFAALFEQKASDANSIFRGNFKALAHSKVFIQYKGNSAIKVLTGSTNFSTNGLCINANHVIIFNSPKIAQLYANVFDASFGDEKMKNFSTSSFAQSDFVFTKPDGPDMTIRFSPHPKDFAEKFFKTISDNIKNARSDVLFAIMKDNSQSGILDAVHDQVKSDKVFTYGIVDSSKETMLYKADSKRGILVAGRGTQTALPPPFNKVAAIPGIAIHHKFVVVDLRGKSSVVYCGSSNLAFNPEQKNGDNLIEIRNDDVVAAFAVEAIRLVDHFAWRNKALNTDDPIYLHDPSDKKQWYESYYNPDDLHCLERTLLISKKN
jgi:hypothetical protein